MKMRQRTKYCGGSAQKRNFVGETRFCWQQQTVSHFNTGAYGLSKEPEDLTTVKENNSKVLDISEFDFTVNINNDIVTRITFTDENDKNIQWINDAI